MIVPHALTFPGLFAPTGLLGAGPQTTAWLYMVWHGGFPLLVISYALLKGVEGETVGPRGSSRTRHSVERRRRHRGGIRAYACCHGGSRHPCPTSW